MTERSRTAREIETQPACWRRAARDARGAGPGSAGLSRFAENSLPRAGERVAVTGCGTSWFMAQAYAALREESGQGETDAFPASEFPVGRQYDRVLALTRSGTTTEVLDLLAELGARHPDTPLVVLTADPASPVLRASRHVAVFDYADEESVVQTRFATTALSFLRAALGAAPGGAEALAAAAAEAEEALREPLDPRLLAAGQWTFLGGGWAYGLALEAALKLREAAGAWTEAYPAMEYRHGPVAVAGPGRVVWVFGPAPAGLADEVAATGALLVATRRDPQAELLRAQRLAVALAEAAGRDPDRPRHLTRSVVLS